MQTFVAFYLGILTLILLAIPVWQYLRGTHELLSFRNLAILGLVVFQVSGAIGAVQGYARPEFILTEPAKTAMIYAIMITVFLVVAFYSYNKGFFVTKLAAVTPTTRATPSIGLLWMIAIALVLLAAVLRFAVPIPLLANLTRPAGVVCATAACGILGWIWGPRFYNPAVIMGVIVLLAAVGIVILTQAFGRRSLVAAGGALLWGMYFSHLRYLRPMTCLWRMALVAFIPLTIVALYTSARESAVRDRSIGEQVRAIRAEGNLRRGLELLAGGQDAGQNSLWLIEQYPGRFETRPLFSIGYTVMYPIPRQMWEEKPLPLSTQLPHMAVMQRVNRDALSLGPGVIGHAAAEGGWWALVIYAVLGGLFVRFLDELVLRNWWSPFTVIPLGASFGHFIGLPRGEIAAFLFLFLLGVSFIYFTMLLLGKLLERVTPWSSTEYVEEFEEGHYEEDAAVDPYGAYPETDPLFPPPGRPALGD